MNEAALQMNRRRFLLTSVGAAAGLIVGPDVFDYLDRIGPRRLLVPGSRAVSVLGNYDEVWFAQEALIALEKALGLAPRIAFGLPREHVYSAVIAR